MAYKTGLYAGSIFCAKAVKRNLRVANPLVDVYGYDFLIEANGNFHKVQVKCNGVGEVNGSYHFSTSYGCKNKKQYSANEIDYFALYLLDIDLFYIIPVFIIKTKTIRIRPNNYNCKFTGYREAWYLLE